MSLLLDEIVADSEALSCHSYGNFVVQKLLRHGSEARVNNIFSCIAKKLPEMASHRTANHVVKDLVGLTFRGATGRLQQDLPLTPGP